MSQEMGDVEEGDLLAINGTSGDADINEWSGKYTHPTLFSFDVCHTRIVFHF